jgi:hypothetical protein
MLRGEVLVAHVHEAALGEACFPPLRVTHPHISQVKAATQIERLPILQNFDAAQVEPLSLVDAESQR